MEENNLYIPSSIADNLPAMVRNELSKISAQKQEEFLEEFTRKKKSIGLGYLLWIIGWHYAYQKKWGIQILFLITFGGAFFWWFIDVFRIGTMIRDFNKDMAVDTLRNLRAISN